MSQPYRAAKPKNPQQIGLENAPAYSQTSTRSQPLPTPTLAADPCLRRSEGSSTLPPLSSLAGFPNQATARSGAQGAPAVRPQGQEISGARPHPVRNAPGSPEFSRGQSLGDYSLQRQGAPVGSSSSSRGSQFGDVPGVQYGARPDLGMMMPHSVGPAFSATQQTTAQMPRDLPPPAAGEPYSPIRWQHRTSMAIPPSTAATASTSPASTSQPSPFQPPYPPNPSGFVPSPQGREAAPSGGGYQQLNPAFATQQALDHPYASSGGTQYMTVETAQGPMSIPVDVQGASRVADEKRKRNAGASARFRARRKEKEHINAKEIDDLKTRIRELAEDADFYRGERDILVSALYNSPERDRYFPRPVSPRRHRIMQQQQQTGETGSESQDARSDSPRTLNTPTFEEHGQRGVGGRHTRRRLTGEDPLPAFEPGENTRPTPGHTGQRQTTGYTYPPTQLSNYPQTAQQFDPAYPRPGFQTTPLPVLSSSRSLASYQSATSNTSMGQSSSYLPPSAGSEWSRDPGRR